MASAMFSYRDFREKGPWFESYLSSRYRKTIFWQSSSSSRKGSQVVPQNSILWTSPSTIFTNDLPNVIENGTVTLFADDTALHCPSAFGWHTVLTEDQVRLSQWLYEQKQTLNISKSKCRWSDYHTNTLTHCNTFARLCGCHMGRLKLFWLFWRNSRWYKIKLPKSYSMCQKIHLLTRCSISLTGPDNLTKKRFLRLILLHIYCFKRFLFLWRF